MTSRLELSDRRFYQRKEIIVAARIGILWRPLAAAVLPVQPAPGGQAVDNSIDAPAIAQAIANAGSLVFRGTALSPMVTMNGERCHNEWEITFEEIHRNRRACNPWDVLIQAIGTIYGPWAGC